MSQINLHRIFSYLVGDENFLSTIVELNQEAEKKAIKKNKFNMMANMVTEYVPLAPYETQKYSLLPSNIKAFLSPDYMRYGIKNIMEKNLNIINISFLNSLNMLLRPELYQQNLEEHSKNLLFLETFISHKLHRNYQIDKVKNTRKVQMVNKERIKNLSEGKISDDLIQSIINIFEINLFVFNLTKMEISFYWSRGIKYPYLNLFKNLCCISYVQGNYEPIMPADCYIPKEQLQKMYTYLLTHSSEIKCYPEISLSISSLIYIHTWSISHKSYLTIVDKFFNKPNKNILDLYDDFQDLI